MSNVWVCVCVWVYDWHQHNGRQRTLDVNKKIIIIINWRWRLEARTLTGWHKISSASSRRKGGWLESAPPSSLAYTDARPARSLGSCHCPPHTNKTIWTQRNIIPFWRCYSRQENATEASTTGRNPQCLGKSTYGWQQTVSFLQLNTKWD